MHTPMTSLSPPPRPVAALALSLALGFAFATVVLPGSTPRASAASFPALAESFPTNTLRSLLVPRSEWHPFPTFADRDAWSRLPEAARAELVRAGSAAAAKPISALPASLYLGYAREGNRSRFEGPYFDRRRRLHQLLLAECTEGQRRFRDPIADTLWAILEESSWCIPAHVGGQRAGVGLPDVDEPIVDLFAAQTASTVAWTLYLYGAELDAVSPRLRIRARNEVQRRILSSYLARDYGWMGFAARTRAARPNNWNPWINGNVLTAALLLETNDTRRVDLVHRVLRSLDRFLLPYPEDGGCDEGPGYWSRAGGSVLDNLDLLHSATHGRIDAFAQPLVREIGRFIHRVHIAEDWYVALGDCSARTGIDRGTVFRYGQRIGDAELRALATHGATVEDLVGEAGGLDLGRGLRVLADLEAILAGSTAPPPLVRDAWLGSDDLQMMIARDRAGTHRGFFVAAWGAHNDQSHNHNDVGNVVVFADGQPVLVDLGAPTYTAKTFSRQRYEIPAMQSSYHNLPTIRGSQQSAGPAFGARDVRYRATDEVAQLDMDLAHAWHPDTGVKTWQRQVRLDRGREVSMADTFELTADPAGTRLNLITPREPREAGPGVLALPAPSAASATARAVALHYDPDQLVASIETVNLDDGRLAGVWGPRVYRIQLAPKVPRNRDAWTVRLRLP